MNFSHAPALCSRSACLLAALVLARPTPAAPAPLAPGANFNENLHAAGACPPGTSALSAQAAVNPPTQYTRSARGSC